ncbi:hypothetical protein [Salinibacter altiplanensis]|uniref:hypothetical protein n=1 Tax=Salinibacter altiplanensis TaxID=1803181 RepID=UPI000C9F44AB|nr:hypothetical protein [Salinibacter altiplanensis]
MKWLKSILIGVLGSLVMFLLMMLGIHGTGVAPFNLPPSAAFLEQLGLNVGPLPLLTHFGYGATWSFVLVGLYGSATNVRRGLSLAAGLWLFMMLVYSPLIGWGIFGVGGAGHDLAPSNPLHLGSTAKYVAATLVLHLVYGAIIGGLNPAWIQFETSSARTQA